MHLIIFKVPPIHISIVNCKPDCNHTGPTYESMFSLDDKSRRLIGQAGVGDALAGLPDCLLLSKSTMQPLSFEGKCSVGYIR